MKLTISEEEYLEDWMLDLDKRGKNSIYAMAEE